MGGDDEEEYPWFHDKAFLPEPDSIEDFDSRLHELFSEIQRRFGRAQAQRMFKLHAEPVVGSIDRPFPPRESKEREVLDLLYTMTPFPNKDQLAQELAEKNKKEARRYGSGATTMTAMRKYIQRAENKVKKRSPNLHLLIESSMRNRIQKLKAAARHRLKKPKPT
jgi:hypothetical protein